MAGWASGIAWTLALIAAAYAASLALRAEGSAVDAAAPLYAAGLLLVAELAYWSLELRAVGREDAVALARRVVALAAVVVASLALGAFVVVVTVVPLGGGLAWDVVGVAAAAATLAILARLARSTSA